MLDASGLFAPIVTPFTDDGNSVSEIRLTRLVRHLIERGVSGFVCGTETGEFLTTGVSERKQVLEILQREARGLPVLVHCTMIGTSQTIDLCQHAARHGAKGTVIMPPYFGQFTEEEIEQHIRRVLQHGGLPVIVVDPKHHVRTAMREKLQSLPGLHHAESMEAAMHTRFSVDPSGLGSDEFVVGEIVVSPLIQIDPTAATNPTADLHSLAKLVGQWGRPRSAKAALQERDIEVGPPRSPHLPLGHLEVQQMVSVIQTV